MSSDFNLPLGPHMPVVRVFQDESDSLSSSNSSGSPNLSFREEEIRKRVFEGEVLSFSFFPEISRVGRQVRSILRECFECAHPPHAHKLYPRDEFLRRAEIAQQRVDSEECRPLFADALKAVGCSTDKLFWDTLGLRVAPPMSGAQDTEESGFRSYVSVHRDTWGVGFQSQVNWWTPLWQLTQRRTMGFYPSYWQRALPNTTDEWSFSEFLASRKQSSGGRAAAYPAAPSAKAQPDEPAAPLIIKPGELACFSSAHLHSSIPNCTTHTRFSLEIRTLHLDDLQSGRGAPNADNQTSRLLTGLFSSVETQTPLKEHWQPS